MLYLEHWKRHSAELAFRWGTLDVKDELLVEPRPLYHVSHAWVIIRTVVPMTHSLPGIVEWFVRVDWHCFVCEGRLCLVFRKLRESTILGWNFIVTHVYEPWTYCLTVQSPDK